MPPYNVSQPSPSEHHGGVKASGGARSGQLAVELKQVRLSHNGGESWALDCVDLAIAPGERWAVLGPNGCGKSTLVQIATGWLHASSGEVEILGARLGQGVDWRRHRERIGVVSAPFARMLRPELTAHDVVMTARYAALEPWWHTYSAEDHQRAEDLLEEGGLSRLVQRKFGTMSEGERQQVLLARARMGAVELLVLDEPAAGLDMGARERLVGSIASMSADLDAPPMLLVTHHLEEIPAGFTHALLLRSGRMVAAGPIREVLTSQLVSDTFDVRVTVDEVAGRWSARTDQNVSSSAR